MVCFVLASFSAASASAPAPPPAPAAQSDPQLLGILNLLLQEVASLKARLPPEVLDHSPPVEALQFTWPTELTLRKLHQFWYRGCDRYRLTDGTDVSVGPYKDIDVDRKNQPYKSKAASVIKVIDRYLNENGDSTFNPMAIISSKVMDSLFTEALQKWKSDLEEINSRVPNTYNVANFLPEKLSYTTVHKSYLPEGTIKKRPRPPKQPAALIIATADVARADITSAEDDAGNENKNDENENENENENEDDEDDDEMPSTTRIRK